VQHASNGDFRHGIADHGGQQHTAQGIAQGVTITTLEGFERDFGTVVADVLDVDGFGFQQLGLHSEFLSIPPARYTGKAG